jgi:NAD(P)-dependent dehydrogenase (short-subunit alcohol dehydrogenase family)
MIERSSCSCFVLYNDSFLAESQDARFEDYERMIAVNVTGTFVATQEAVRRMKAGGRVIHIGSSMVKYTAFPTASPVTSGRRASR